MMAETPRNLALMVLNGLSDRPSLSATSLEDVFRRKGPLDERDRALIYHLVHGVLRWRLRLDWIIEQRASFPIRKINPPILNILRLALYQIFFLDRIPESAAVNEAVNQSKAHGPRHVVSFVNGMLRSICRERDKIPFPDRDRDKVHYLSVFHSYPRWLVKKWIGRWGARFTEELLAAGNRMPVLTLRTNRLRLRRDQLMMRLSADGIEGRQTPYAPEGILLEEFRGRADELAAFGEGLFQVQDQAAQITSHLLIPRPAENILDLCAGLGGKSTHLAELSEDRGRVLALDISHRRLLSLGQGADRLGIDSIIPVVADASRSLPNLLRCKFDKIMVDAPCSGLGVLTRHPDGKWNRNERDIARLSRLQETMLHEAAALLRVGGRMLYVVCTISEEENEGVVEGFLRSNRDISLENLKDHVPDWGTNLIDDKGYLRTFPHLHHMDGFFAALFTKTCKRSPVPPGGPC